MRTEVGRPWASMLLTKRSALHTLVSLSIRWTWASYSPLTFRQLLVGFGLGQGLGWTLVLSLAGGWPVWQQGLAATELSFLSLTVGAWTLRRLGVGLSATVEQDPASKTARARRAV